MKKTVVIAGWIVVGILLLFVLVRVVFRARIEEGRSNAPLQKRVELLRSAGSYGADSTDLCFTYTQDTLRAREIRTYFRLDTLLDPSAPTWENTLALARFVARNIPHANQQVQPQTRNSTALWEYHLHTEPAFNCRLHAILLHELLLASDIVNRFVTCLPADSLDSDCHVVNIVWLPEREKWAMIDSDQQAYAATPDGVPLSLAEMRSRYIAGEPIEYHALLGEEEDFGDYRAYWAKNLYWFECWEQTGFDKEVGFEGRTVALLPAGYGGFSFNRNEIPTTDAHRFWAAPANGLQKQ
ncbi:transglutaminase domain-containing protein [Alistipes sp.]|uniref:transglutaminase domain-containing protein n=1 Tax=Alistipes sp. TaxID=1872444 RepID=UPI003AEF6C70